MRLAHAPGEGPETAACAADGLYENVRRRIVEVFR